MKIVSNVFGTIGMLITGFVTGGIFILYTMEDKKVCESVLKMFNEEAYEKIKFADAYETCRKFADKNEEDE